MSAQDQNKHRISDEEMQKLLRNAEKSDNPEVQTTDHTIINADTGEVKGINLGGESDQLMDTHGKYPDAGTGTGAGVGIGTAAHGAWSTEEDAKEAGATGTAFGSDEYPVPMSGTRQEENNPTSNHEG